MSKYKDITYWNAPIYSRKVRRIKELKAHERGGDYRGVKWIDERAAGIKPELLSGCPLDWVPEYTHYNLETGKILARGWRDILLVLANKGAINLERAKKIFRCNSLGEHTFDKADVSNQLKILRKGTDHEDQRSARRKLADQGFRSFR